jgi:heptosyltransferase-2
MKLTDAKKILVTDLMHIGDIVFISPFLHVLRRAVPQAEITLLVDLRTHEVVKYNPNINRLLTIDKKGKDDNYKALWHFAAMLRDYRYDMMINLHPTERCSFLAAFSGAKYKNNG